MSGTVKVGCRLPQGVVLRVSEWVKDSLGDRVLRETGTITLAGSGQHVATPGLIQGEDEDAAFTEVPSDLWSKWWDANKDSDLVQSGAVFKGTAKDKTDEEKTEADKAEAKTATGAVAATAQGTRKAP